MDFLFKIFKLYPNTRNSIYVKINENKTAVTGVEIDEKGDIIIESFEVD
jgi:hypothetical protein